MTSLNSDSGLSGTIGFIVAVLTVAVVIQFVSGSLVHYVPILAAIVVGIVAVKTINGS